MTNTNTSNIARSTQWMNKLNSTDFPKPVPAKNKKPRFISSTHKSRYSKKYKAIYSPPPSQFIDMTKMKDTNNMSRSSISGNSNKLNKTVTFKDTKSKRIGNPYKRKDCSSSTIISPDKIKREKTDNHVVDMTLPPTMKQLREDASLFFTYDPRGDSNAAFLNDQYCTDCLCPTPYCAEKLFGPMCYKHVERMVAKD